MSKRPWMPLDISDYLQDTGHLTVAEHGAYLMLIMHYWVNDGLPTDERMIARLSRMTADQWAESRDVIAALFRDGWRHKRIDEEMAKAEEIIGKRKAAANARHADSKPDAHAEQVDSTSTYTRVPPLPKPLVIEPPAPNSGPGAREDFDVVWEAFPRNHSSSETSARDAFSATKVKDRPAILAAALRYRQWFAEDNEARGRTEDEGLRFVPHLATWLSKGTWKDAAALRLKAEANQPDPNLVVLRDGDPMIKALEQRRGRKFLMGPSGTVTVTKADVAAVSSSVAA